MVLQQRRRVWQITVTVCGVLAIASLGWANPPGKTSIKLFESRPVTVSGSGVTVGHPFVFDQVVLVMGCPAKPTATISSTQDGSGKIVVDNVLAVNGVNVCADTPYASCFGTYFGQVGDAAVAAYTPVGPLEVRQFLASARPWQVMTFQLQDLGVLFANSDIWFTTNCKVHNKVALCHKPGTPAEHLINVAQSSVSAHLAHGDYIGTCRLARNR